MINTAGVLLAGLLAVGALNLVLGFGDTIGQLLERLFLFTRRPVLQIVEEREDGSREAFDPYGLDHVPWEILRLASAGAGVGFAALLFWERSPYLAILGLAGGYVPSMVRAYLLRRAKRRVDVEVRHFLRTLKGLVPAYGGLYPALRAVSDVQGGLVEERLKRHMRTGKNAIEILAALADDLRAEQLEILASRLQEAQEGLDQPDEVLRDALERIEQEVFRATKEAIGGAPIRLLIPMLILMVPPVLILALYPPVARMMALIAGAGPGVSW
jgi:hypothetical protein